MPIIARQRSQATLDTTPRQLGHQRREPNPAAPSADGKDIERIRTAAVRTANDPGPEAIRRGAIPASLPP